METIITRDSELEITIEASKMPADLNKFISATLKELGMNVRDSKVQLLVKAEAGRTWIKYPGQTSVTAYG